MGKLVEQGGRFFRERRGRLVEVPPEWLGMVTTDKTKRGRRQAARGKRRRWGWSGRGQRDRARLRAEQGRER